MAPSVMSDNANEESGGSDADMDILNEDPAVRMARRQVYSAHATKRRPREQARQRAVASLNENWASQLDELCLAFLDWKYTNHNIRHKNDSSESDIHAGPTESYHTFQVTAVGLIGACAAANPH
ncbi:MAG TPA: hypothetical protein VGO47_12575 [Chlamydiales bacterium]|jgi:hypothetical protein|nr:hypothetical protein [Chlamydiales bacterium]